MGSNPVTSSTEGATNFYYNGNLYFLHSGLQLVMDYLTPGADFHSWRRSVCMALNVWNKLGFVDGTIRKPHDNHRELGSLSRCNDMVATWVMNSSSKKIGQRLLFMTTTERMRNNLMSQFMQDDAPRLYEIEQRLSNIKQGSMDISAYYTELVTFWEEYKTYIKLLVCNCGRCECNATAMSKKLQQRNQLPNS